MKMTWLDKPVCDRAIYQQIKQRSISSIVEFGMDDGYRCENMIAVATKFSQERIRYTGVDLFDARPEDPLKLIEMHRLLKSTGAKTQLVPGDIGSVIPRIANSHLRTDLIIFSSGYDANQFAEVKMFLPRMLHASSLVMIQDEFDGPFQQLTRLQIEKSTAQGNQLQKVA